MLKAPQRPRPSSDRKITRRRAPTRKPRRFNRTSLGRIRDLPHKWTVDGNLAAFSTLPLTGAHPLTHE